MGFITGKDNKLVKTPVGIYLHDMPEYGASADFHHRLGENARFFR
jgi:hypothetical protein